MPQLQITCFGTFQVLLDDVRVTAFPTDKARALLVYLAVEGQAHTRIALAQLLWPGYSEESANNSLRQTLHRLRQLLHDAEDDTPWLLITRQTVQLNPEVAVTVDVSLFTKLIEACYTHPHTQLARCQPCLERLRQAVALYHGDFLAGITIADSDPFEEWRRIMQEQCHVAALDALQLLTDACDTSGDFEEAQRFAERQIVLEPWREQAHRQLMRVLARAGRRSAALVQYHTCRQLLLEELGSEPEAVTTDLYEQIRSGELEERKPSRIVESASEPPSEAMLPALPEAKSEQAVSPALPLASDAALPQMDETHEAAPPSTVSTPMAPPPDLELAVAPVSPPRHHNLPPLLTPPLGRQAMIERTRAALAVAPLVTLTGVGGVGKTTLALQVASTLVDEYDDGVWLVELARLADAQLLPASLATALGLREAAETEMLDTLISYLQSKELLLLLDNCEHVLSAAHQLCSQLLTSCPHVRILATSRTPLRLRDEQVLAVGPLPTPTTLPPVAELINYPAVQLFVTRVQAINPRFTLTDQHAATVLEICQRLDGLPLALELAAARVRLLSLQEIAERLDRRFSLLRAAPSGQFANGALRHQTLRATIDWGYDLLSEAEQRLFRHLALFAGGFTLAAVEAMSGEEALDLLAALVDKSFVVQERNAQNNRFFLLDTLRDYALEKLIATDEEAAARQQHLNFFLQLAEQAESYYNSSSQLEWFNRIAEEHDNLRAALAWAMRPAAGSSILALRLVGALGCFWEVRGYLSEAKEALLHALAIVPTDSAVNQWRAKALYWAGGVMRLLGDYAQAKALLQDSLTLHQSLHNQAGMAQVLIRLGMIWDDEGKYDEALRYYEESHHIYQQLGDNWGISVALNNRSSVAYYRGDYVTARRLAEESVARIRLTGDQRHLANFLTTLAEATQLLQDFATTRQALAEAFAIHSANGDKMRSTVVLCGWAEVDRMQGDTLQARQRYLQSLSLAFALWERRRIAISLEGVARCTAALGDPQLAVELWSVAATLRSIIGSPLPPVQIPEYEADLAAAKQSLGEALFSTAWDTGRWLSLDQALRKAEAWEAREEEGKTRRAGEGESEETSSPGASLPFFVTPLVGRSRELAEIAAQLQRPAVRLLTLIGPGGMGKTRLASAVGQQLTAVYPDGVWFISLAALTNPAAIATAIATALHLPIEGDNPRTALAQMLQSKQMLLILDNFEHLLAGGSEGVELVATLLQAAPKLQMLVTSRERLQLRGEQIYQVPPLTVNLNASLAEATTASAVLLFVQSARFVQANFQLTPTNLATVLRICQLVQGIPLGLELAAAYVGTLPLNAIADEIATSAEFLTVDWHDLPPRQRSMRAVFDWSWQLLSAEEQRALRQISIFQGGFDQAAAETVAGAPRAILNRLQHKSLLQYQEITPNKVRYFMHDLLRQFAAEKLQNAQVEAVAVAVRHSTYYLAFLAERESPLTSNGSRQAADEIQAEIHNMQQAWTWAATHQTIDNTDLSTALERAAYSLWEFCDVRRPRAEAEQMVRLVLEHATPLLTGAPDTPQNQQRRAMASKLFALHARTLIIQGKPTDAAIAARQAISIGQATANLEGEAIGVIALAQALIYTKQPAEARICAEQALDLARRYRRQAPNNAVLADVERTACEYLAVMTLGAGNYQGSREYMLQGVQLCQSLGKERGEQHCLHLLARLAYLHGDYGTAQREYQQSLALARRLGHQLWEAYVLIGLGQTLHLQGDYPQALTAIGQGLTLAHQIDDLHSQTIGMADLCRLHCLLGNTNEATLWATRLQQFLETRAAYPESRSHGLSALAFHAQFVGKTAQALDYAQQAWQTGQEFIAYGTAISLIMLGHAQADLERWSAAAESYEAAIAAYSKIGNLTVAAEPQAGLAQIALTQGNLSAALAQVEIILPLLAEQPRTGFNDPFFIYLIVYRVLAANNDPRAAALLEQGHALLQQDAASLADASRQRFLSAVPAHRDLVAAYRERQASPDKVTRWQGDKESTSPSHLVTQSPLHNLPSVLPRLIGRERELTEIAARLQKSSVRLLTLAGPGGMGKTRLALAAAAQLAPYFAAGVCLVELAELTEPARLPQTVAAALGQTELAEAGEEDPVARYVGDKALLLVLDNCEHVDEVAAYWSKRWLSACPRLRILTTSHGALTVPGEVVWPIPTLAYPPTTELAADQLLVFAAVQLFVTRAKEVKADFALTAANGAAVAEICRQLEGIPLAIELAAARVRSLTPKEIAQRLKQGIAAALANNRSAPARHQTMQAALDWSFAALGADEQLLFQQLSVFAGGFTLPAVEIVTQVPDALDLLERLIDRALVLTETVSEQTRYRLLGIIRKYAADKLSASDMAPALRQRHAAYFLQLAESAQMEFQADGEALWLQPEAENLSSALDWALAHAEAGIAVRLAGALTWYWWIRGYLRAQRTALQKALASLESTSQQDKAVRNAPVEPTDPVEPALRALAAGALFSLWEEPDKARLAFTQALKLAEAAPNQQLIGLALRRLAAVAIQQKAYEAANEFIERGLIVWQALGVIWHVAWLYALQGDLAEQLGDHEQAWLAYEASSRLPVDPGARAYPLRRMAYLALARGERSQALALCRESLQLNRATGDRQGIAACLVGVAHFTVADAQTRPQAVCLLLLRRATELLGAVETLLQTVEGQLLQADEVAHQQTTQMLQEQLAAVTPEVYRAALAAGRALTVEQATALALQEEAIPPPAEPLQPQETANLQSIQVTESPPHPITPDYKLPSPPPPSPLLDWAEMPAVDLFVERQAEVAQLTAWLTPTEVGAVPAQMISILGMGGMGKTTLAALMTKAVAPHFAVVIWRSLLNAPPLSELLRTWLQILSRQTLTTLSDSLDEQLRLLLTHLQQERCLLVLDNVESIFTVDPPGESTQSRAGVTRPGYEGYDQLFQRLASSDHQSCLLLTSREQPYALLRSGRQAQMSGRVQVLPLTGLDQQAGYILLQNNGLHTSAAEAAQLIKNYSGNPLALQIVASTIADFFGGDVAAFQQEDGALFDGMRIVLDQQFARLSPLERDILVWLAIEREAISVPNLRSNFVQPVATAPMLEALQALQNRSLLEKRDNGLTLQNVIIEYTTEYLVKEVCRELTNDNTTLEDFGAQSFLNRFALLKAQSKEYSRQSQERLILQPVAVHWQKSWRQKQENLHGQQLLNVLRQNGVQRGYAAGNLLNLLIHLGVDLSGYDFSELCVWQADLRHSVVRNINLAQSDLADSSFIQTFSRIENVAISPNGQLLAAAGDGGAIRLFRLPNGEPHSLLTGHTNTITSVNFSPDGAYLASTGDDGLILLWTIHNGQLHRQLGEYPAMRVITFSPDGRLLAGASRSGAVLLWQVENGHLLRTLPLHTQRVNALAFHPDGKLLASASSDGTIYLLNVSNLLQEEDARSDELAGSDPQQISRHIRTLVADPKVRFFTVAFSPDGQRLVAGNDDGKLYAWDAPFDAVTQQALGHRGQIRALVFCADSRFFFSGGYDGAIRLWDSQDMRCCQTLSGHQETVYSLALGWQDQLMASGSEDATICLWEVNTQTQSILRQRLRGYPQALECVAWSGCGRWLATGDIHGSVRLWDLQHATPPCTQEIIGESTVISLSFTRDGQQLAIGRYADPKGIQIWEIRADGQWYLRSGQRPPLSGVACFSADASLLATCANDGILRLWNTQSLTERAGPRLFIGHDTYVNRMTFAARGQAIATCSSDLYIRLWRIDTGEETHRLPGFGNNTCLAVNPQGTLLACSAADFAIALWNLADPAAKQPLYHLIGHTNEAFACAFSPDGQLLVSAGLDRSVRLWDVQTGTQRALLGYHEQYALDVAFSPNGQQVASIGKEGALYIWQIAPSKRLHQLHAHGPYAGMNITGVTGISDAQKATLRALGAVDEVKEDKERESPSHPVIPATLLDWADMPAVDLFVERTAEIAELKTWLTPSATGGISTQLISILGMGGMGKTTLAAVVTKAVASRFQVVIWRSLLNAPPLSELLRNWLQTLSRQTLTSPPDSLDEQLRLLLTYLQQERCLLVLDNVESIFAAESLGESTQSRAGVVRPGYEGYDQLFQRLASSDHQSCLLLTSREQPYALLRPGRQAQVSGRVQVLPLAGLDQQAGVVLLQNNGLHTSAAEAAQLVKNYSGNPLALQIVASTIADFFGGDVAAFQQEEGALFDGMRLILDQQFARLSPIERDILVWLAIEREPITVPTLRANFVQPVATPQMIEALQALQNRSLLEKSGEGLFLQNVIIEYTTEYLVEQVCQEIVDGGWWIVDSSSTIYHPPSTINGSFLNRFALLKAQAKQYVRQSQVRLILQPVADRVVTRLARAQLVARIPQLLDALRAAGVQKGYAGGNLLNLLVCLGEELIGYDFSSLPVWQADLSGLAIVTANFTGADLGRSTFTAGIMVDSIAFQPTGELWVAGLQNGVLGLWRTVEGILTDAFQRTDNLRAPLVFSPDGRFLATDAEDYRIRIWSTSTGECLRTLDAHQSTLYTMAFSNDGMRLASCSSGRIVRLWDLRTGRCYQQLRGYDQGADALAFSPDGQLLATGGGDGRIQLWDTHSTAEAGRQIAAWQAHHHSLGALAFSPDGRWLASGSHASEIQLWAVEPIIAKQSQEGAGDEIANRPYRAEPVFQGHTSIIRALCFVPTSDSAAYLLASASADRTVRIWSLTGQLRNTLLGHTNAIHSLSVSPDGQQLASAGNDKQIFLWDVATGQALHSQQAYRSALQCLAYSPDGKMLACGGADPIVRLWSVAEDVHSPLAIGQTTEPPVVQTSGEVGQVRHLLRGHTHFLCSVAISPDGQTVASGDADRTIRLWDRATGQALQTVREHQWSVRALAFAPTQLLLPKGESLLASAGADRIIRLWSVSTQQMRKMQRWRQLIGHEDEILTLAFEPRGRHLVSGCADGSIRIWDVQSGVTRYQLTGHTAPVTSVAIHPHDNIIASSCYDQTIRLWDLTAGTCLQVNRGTPIGTDAVAFSPDGQYLAFTGNDFAIYLWPWRTATVAPILPTYPLRGHTGNVNALSFSPTAAYLASCSDDGTIRLWDVENKCCCQILHPPGPYAGMKITDVRGISEAQKASLRALGAIEE